jgi:beta-N-acetylhexosaminidase
MAGISHYFTEVEAVVETFVAGADLAVMPFKVRKPSDITEFYTFIKQVAQALSVRIEQADYNLTDFELSLTRLNRYKEHYIKLPSTSLANKVQQAKKVIASNDHLNVEQALANAAITLLQGDIKNLLSNIFDKKIVKQIHLMVANEQELFALNYAMKQVLVPRLGQTMPHISHFIAGNDDFEKLSGDTLIKKADLLIATIDVKTASLVDIGGMDDLASIKTRAYGSETEKHKKQSYSQLLKEKLISAKKQNLMSVLVAKGSPYLLSDYKHLAEIVLLNFDDRIYSLTNENLRHDKQPKEQVISPGFNAAMAIVFSQRQAGGSLPVTLNNK